MIAGIPGANWLHVGDDGIIAGKLLVVLGDIGLQALAANLLLTLDQKLDIHRKLAGRLQPGLHRFQMREHLPFVVGRPPGVEVAVANGRLERRREPWLQGLRRLHVVVAIHEQGWFTRGLEPFRINQGMAFGRDQLGLQSHRGQIVADEGSRSPRIGIVVRLGADAGNPDEVLELCFEVISMLFEIRVDCLEPP